MAVDHHKLVLTGEKLRPLVWVVGNRAGTPAGASGQMCLRAAAVPVGNAIVQADVESVVMLVANWLPPAMPLRVPVGTPA